MCCRAKALLTTFGFKKPVVLTLAHMTACSVMGYMYSWTKVFPKQKIHNSTQLIKICMLAAVFVTSILMGNISLRYIPVSFKEATVSSLPSKPKASAVMAGTRFRKGWGTVNQHLRKGKLSMFLEKDDHQRFVLLSYLLQ